MTARSEGDDVDLFAGPGGWDAAARRLGLDPCGVELDAAACETRAAVGLRTVEGDVAALDPAAFAPVRGLIASAPCPTFSAAGNGGGRRLSALIVRCARDAITGRDTRAETTTVARALLEPVYIADDTETAIAKGRAPDPDRARSRAARDAAMSLLVVEPVRWAVALRPRWVALEQVEAVQPLWTEFAGLLRGLGYGTWTGVLSAEQYGVPQTRRRAILLASLDRQPRRPPPTHQRYVVPRPSGDEATEALFDAPAGRIVHPEDRDLLPWVSMADALKWGMTMRPVHTITGGGTRGGGGVEITGGGDVRRIVERERERGAWLYRSSGRPRATERGISDPAPAEWVALRTGNFSAVARDADGGRSSAGSVPYERPITEPAPTVRSATAGEWVAVRPATSVNGDPRISAPGRHDPEVSGSQQAGAVRVSLEEALVLQGFRADYPLRGSRTKRYEQVGNAVPPPFAEAILRELVNRAGTSSA